MIEFLNKHIDKLVHFLGGYFIASFFDPWTGFGVAFVAGILKEARDSITGKGTPESLDAIATALGGLVWFLRWWV